jgi:hypothetical protein
VDQALAEEADGIFNKKLLWTLCFGFVSGHDFTACGKTHFSEGYGLQSVRKCLAMNPALAAEGRFLFEAALFPQAV